mmetsp:Transcript_20145/g.45857  ORF Transcript_20145/g.45857 Transcript_20145/m.45857 type:complete len:85 (-) Transcript_20145:87-341(-)
MKSHRVRIQLHIRCSRTKKNLVHYFCVCANHTLGSDKTIAQATSQAFSLERSVRVKTDKFQFWGNDRETHVRAIHQGHPRFVGF